MDGEGFKPPLYHAPSYIGKKAPQHVRCSINGTCCWRQGTSESCREFRRTAPFPDMTRTATRWLLQSRITETRKSHGLPHRISARDILQQAARRRARRGNANYCSLFDRKCPDRLLSMFCGAVGRGVWSCLRVVVARTSSAVSANAFLLQVRPISWLAASKATTSTRNKVSRIYNLWAKNQTALTRRCPHTPSRCCWCCPPLEIVGF